MPDRDFIDQLSGYSLTTAEIIYRLPDYPAVLQAYIWQEYDQAPRFPRLKQFLDYWAENLDGSLHRIRIAHATLLRPQEVIYAAGRFNIN
ncbi:MAG: protein usg [Hyphomicrobiaceae bacterium]